MRFQFDEQLLGMRRDFENYKERLRRTLMTKYNLKAPESPMVVLK
jgi:hypothetical protein